MNDILNDGTIRQDGLVFRPRDTSGEGAYRIHYPVLAQVVKVYDTDDEENREGSRVLCDLLVEEMGITLQRVPVMVACGGADNYIHFPIHDGTKNVDDSEFDELIQDRKLTNGDTAVVQFLMGDVARPIITAIYPHFQAGVAGVCPSPRPKKDDKKQFKLRINGTNLTIDKDGNVIFDTTDVIGQDKSEVKRSKKFALNFTNKDEAGHLFVFDMTDGAEEVTITHLKGSLVKMDKDGNVLIADSEGDTVYLDAANKTASVASSQGSLITLKDDIVLVDKTGANIINLKDDTLQLTAGKNVIVSAPSCTLECGTVNLGTAAVFHATVYENLKTVFDGHTHATGVGPSGPPLPPSTLALAEASPATSVKAEYVLLRANV